MKQSFPSVVRAGDFLFLSGQAAIDTASMTVVGEDVTEQARYCMDGMREVLESENATLRDVVRVECFLTDAADLRAWDAVFVEYFPDDPPARTTLVTGLVLPSLRIEIQATALSRSA